MPSIINASTAGAGGVITTADASGVLQLQTAGTTALAISAAQAVTLANALPAASGGTGLTAPGTSGNVLTSNGTAWTSAALPAGGVTSLNGQTGAITNTDLYAIGSYITGRPQNTTGYAANSTIAGSSLYSIYPQAYRASTTWADPVNGNTTAQVLINTGTWRCVTGSPTVGTVGMVGLWVRIS
jgi:hypothetical protein